MAFLINCHGQRRSALTVHSTDASAHALVAKNRLHAVFPIYHMKCSLPFIIVGLLGNRTEAKSFSTATLLPLAVVWIWVSFWLL